MKRCIFIPSSSVHVCMCVCVCVRSAVLVAVTVWNQKGSRNKFRKRGVYHIPAEHESWEDIRENILNYNEEGGGEQDQVHRTKHTHNKWIQCSAFYMTVDFFLRIKASPLKMHFSISGNQIIVYKHPVFEPTTNQCFFFYFVSKF